MTIHMLKIDRVFLDALLDGSKTFEVRYNDRGYQKSDVLRFDKHFPETGCESAACTLHNVDTGADFEVTYVSSGLGIKENFVVLGLKKVSAK